MLQSIRDKAQNWIFLIIIFLLVITFAFFGIERFFTGSVSSKVVAKVDGHKVTQQEFNVAYQRLKRQLQLQLGTQFTLTPKIEANLKKEALDQIVHSYVLSQAATNQGYRVTPAQVDAVLQSIPMFQEKGQFSPTRFQAILNNLFYTESSFLAQLQTDMIINQEESGIISSAFVLPNEVVDAYKLMNQKRDISYVVVPLKHFSHSVKVSDSEIENYYQSHQQQYTTPEKVSIAYLELSLADIIAKQHFSEGQLKEYYENNLASYTLPPRWHAAQILIRLPEKATPAEMKAAEDKVSKVESALKSKQDFAKVAKKYSEDIISAKNGGLLPWFSKGMAEPEMIAAVSKLRVGEVSKPVRTKYGLSIFKLEAHKAEKVEPFIAVKKRIQDSMAQQNAQKEFANQSDQLANLTFSDSNSLESAAKALNLKIQTTPLFTNTGLKTGLASDPKIVNAAFSNTALVEKYNSNPIQLNPTTVVVLRVKQHLPAKVLPLKQVKADVKETLLKEKSSIKAKQLAAELVKQAKTLADLKSAAEKSQLKLESASNVSQHDSKVNTAVLTASFNLNRPMNKTTPSVKLIALANGDYAVVALTKVIDDSKAMSDSEIKSFRNQMSKEMGMLDFQLYAKHQIKLADVKKYTKNE